MWFEGPLSPNNIDLGPLSDENQTDSNDDDELLVNSASSVRNYIRFCSINCNKISFINRNIVI